MLSMFISWSMTLSFRFVTFIKGDPGQGLSATRPSIFSHNSFPPAAGYNLLSANSLSAGSRRSSGGRPAPPPALSKLLIIPTSFVMTFLKALTRARLGGDADGFFQPDNLFLDSGV